MSPTTGEGSAGGRPPSGVSRRRFLSWVLGAGLALGAAASATAGYALVLEPGWLQVKRVPVVLPGLPPALDGLSIAHLTDLHWGRYTGLREIRAAVDAANALEPDLVVLTGDYVLGSAAYAEPCGAELAALRAPLGVYAVAGNHDYWTDITTVGGALAAAGLPLMRNEARRLEVAGSVLWLAGLDDVYEGHDDLESALAPVPPGEPVLLLVHEPDFAVRAALAPWSILLQLSGHSHGGQVCLPFVGPPILPWLGRIYPAGLQAVAGASLQVYTNRGVGVTSPPVRLNCRPEVALLTLQAAG
ncbi:MAG: metallophosphoesterase [Anaerolineaceae bacterium]|nr:metallophosphoesterase [Anaerolineaceae bacterium]